MKGSFAQVSRFLHPPSPTLKAYPRRELAMAWGPVVVGVDASPAAVGAAVLAELIAKLAAVRCDLVHAVRDAWAPLVAVNPDPEVVEMQLLQQAVARERVHHVLKGAVSHRVLETLKVRLDRRRSSCGKSPRKPGQGCWSSAASITRRWSGGSAAARVYTSCGRPKYPSSSPPASPSRRAAFSLRPTCPRPPVLRSVWRSGSRDWWARSCVCSPSSSRFLICPASHRRIRRSITRSRRRHWSVMCGRW